MLIYNIQSITSIMSHKSRVAFACHMAVKHSTLFSPKIRIPKLKAQICIGTQRKRERQGPFVSKKVIKVLRLFTINDLEKYTIS